MADCLPFRLHIGENLPEVVAELRQELARRGATVSGDVNSGSFSAPLPIGGAIAGSYAVSGGSLTISISQRPSAISCGAIEAKLHDAVLDVKASIKTRHR